MSTPASSREPTPRSASHRRSPASRNSRPAANPAPAAKHSNGNGSSNGHKPQPPARPARPSRSRSRRGGGGSGSAGRISELTSHPTSRNAYIETRQWLLAQHGPVCAYCGVCFTARVMTLDHVAPRRGQTAYDRRDNLVLACPGCNMAKRDSAPLAFLLGSRNRAVNLARYGAHLSPMLVDLARSLVPGNGNGTAATVDAAAVATGWAALLEMDGESPYRD